MITTIIAAVASLVIGLLLPSPVFKKSIKAVKEIGDLLVVLTTALKPDKDDVVRITKQEIKDIKKEALDIVKLWH